MIWTLCLLLSLKGMLVQSKEKPNFGLFCPPDLYYPSEEKFCIHASGNLKGYSRLVTNLKTSSGIKTLHTILPNMPAWQCQSFQVPEPSEQMEKVEIEVQGIMASGKAFQLASKYLTVWMKSAATIIQTDKPVYKAGQNINFRVLLINQDMEVQNNNFSLIELQDSKGNRLAQWKDVVPKSGIAELCYQLDKEPNLGKYVIKANDAKMELEVLDYVPPKFEPLIDAPNSISVIDSNVTISAYGRYTYGEKVQGNVTLKICQKKKPKNWWWWRPAPGPKDVETKDLCYNEVAVTDQTGKMQCFLDLRKFNLRSSDYARELTIDMMVEEEGTGAKFSAAKSIKLESQLTKLSFRDTKSYFIPGVPYRGKLSLVSFDGRPIALKKVHIRASYNGEENKETFVTDSSGDVTFELSTEKWDQNSVSLQATTDDIDEPYSSGQESIKYGRANLYLKDIYVDTKSYLYIHPVQSSAPCHENVAVTVDYFLEGEQNKDCFELFYLVILNGKIVQQGQKKVQRAKSDPPTGSVKFSLPIRDISSSGNILAFIVSESGAVAADTRTVQVTPCLKHAVNLKFSEEKVLPKSNVKMNLQANAGSFCAVRAVDKSVVLMKPENELTESKFKNLVKAKTTHIRSDSLDYNMCNQRPLSDKDEDLDMPTRWDPWWWHSYPQKKKDIQNIVQDNGLYVLSTWKIFAPVTCRTQRSRESFLVLDEGINRPPMMKRAKQTMLPKGAISRLPSPAGPMPMPGGDFGIFSISVSSENAPSTREMDSEEEAPAVMKVFDYDFPEEEEVEVASSGSDEPRVFFPETWLWDIQQVSSSGSSDVLLTVPDTITEWTAQMFCVGDGGLGLSSPSSLIVFQPFFVEIVLPFSVKRGETMQLKASIFNYRSDTMMIKSSIAESDQFILSNRSDRTRTICLPAGQKRTIAWQLTPMELGSVNISVTSEAVRGQCAGKDTAIPDKGRRDTVIQPLLVEPEGTLVDRAHNSMLISEGSEVSERVTLQLPKSYVVGSERGFISFTGDILGSALNNLESLLAMSYGCGEQNMLRFAPNVYILQYLKSSNQLTDDVLQKGKKFLAAGQQRQLTYQHSDGSYSAFGKSDPEGSTWLTAFVIKSFSQAQEFSFIDDKHIKQGLTYLKNQQQDNGCFKARGRVLHNGMKGGVDDEVSLTAYVVVALLEAGIELQDPVVEKALQCMKNEPAEEATLYKMALKLYAYTLANCSGERATVMQLLDKTANKGDRMMFWSQEAKVHKELYWAEPKSVNVEITSYILLSMTSLASPTSKDIGDMVAITRWMCKQQNGNGGFSSTQDTVVGLHSLSKFASMTSGKFEEVIVDVTSEGGFRYRLLINEDNRLLLQKVTLPGAAGEFLVTASGVGTVFMQVVQRYHTPPDIKDSVFGLSVQSQCLEDEKLAVFLEFWYKGNRLNTNMALLEVKMLSGFVHLPESIEEVKKEAAVKRVEIDNDVINIYIEEVTTEHQTLEILLQRSVSVTGLKPAYVKIFDYYMPEEENTVCYLSEC